MEQPSNNAANRNASQEIAKPKQPWRKPTVTFVPLNATAADKGSPTDGNTGSILG